MNGSGRTKTGIIQPNLPLAAGGCAIVATLCVSALSHDRGLGLLFLLAFEIVLLSLVPLLDRRGGFLLFVLFNTALGTIFGLRYLGWL